MNERTLEQIREDNETRLRRAAAWISRAKCVKYPTDDTSRFIFYWIAFNALYSQDEYGGEVLQNGHERIHDKERMKVFFKKISDKDKKCYLDDVVAHNIEAIRKIFELPQTYDVFWNPKNDKIKDMSQWRKQFAKEKNKGETIMEKKTNPWALKKIFFRIYVVRNQIFHGSHSGGLESYGYTQVEKGSELLGEFIPCFHRIMEISIANCPDEDWGSVYFRRQGESDDENCPPLCLLDNMK